MSSQLAGSPARSTHGFVPLPLTLCREGCSSPLRLRNGCRCTAPPRTACRRPCTACSTAVGEGERIRKRKSAFLQLGHKSKCARHAPANRQSNPLCQPACRAARPSSRLPSCPAGVARSRCPEGARGCPAHASGRGQHTLHPAEVPPQGPAQQRRAYGGAAARPGSQDHLNEASPWGTAWARIQAGTRCTDSLNPPRRISLACRPWCLAAPWHPC